MTTPDTSLDPDLITGKAHRAIVSVIEDERDNWRNVAKSSVLVNAFAALLLAAIVIAFVVTR